MMLNPFGIFLGDGFRHANGYEKIPDNLVPGPA